MLLRRITKHAKDLIKTHVIAREVRPRQSQYEVSGSRDCRVASLLAMTVSIEDSLCY